MEALLLSLGGCMAIDIRAILEKGRVPLEELVVDVEGERATEPPQRFVRIHMDVRAVGPGEADRAKVERAVQLSRDKYCSVFHTLRPDMDVEIRIQLE
jgi:putative redox protein